MTRKDNDDGHATGLDFESLVDRYYRPLYQFAFSLTRTEADACDLTQQTFYFWATKGHQLHDATKVKTWLFTTLHREFLATRRRQSGFPQHEPVEADHELPVVSPAIVNEMDTTMLLQSLARVQEPHRAPLLLFYLEDFSYKQMAEVLGVPLGTVRSRIARGLVQLRRFLLPGAGSNAKPEEGNRE